MRNLQVNLHTSKKVAVTGETDLKVACMIREFKIVNHVKIYSQEEVTNSKTFTIDNGKSFFCSYVHIYFDLKLLKFCIFYIKKTLQSKHTLAVDIILDFKLHYPN